MIQRQFEWTSCVTNPSSELTVKIAFEWKPPTLTLPKEKDRVADKKNK